MSEVGKTSITLAGCAVIVSFAVGLAIDSGNRPLKAQTRLSLNSQTQHPLANLVDGAGTHITFNADGTGQLDVLRPIRRISAQGSSLPSDCHSLIIATVPSDYSFALAQPDLSPGTYPNGCEILFRNLGPGTLTIVASGVNLTGSGLTSKPIPAKTNCAVDSDSVLWEPEC